MTVALDSTRIDVARRLAFTQAATLNMRPASWIARRLEVTKRTVERYRTTLRAQGRLPQWEPEQPNPRRRAKRERARARAVRP